GGVGASHATFTRAELEEALPPHLVQPAAEWYGVTSGGNWEGRAIPVRPVGAPLRRPPEIEEARVLLAAARAQRVQPARDEKGLTEWTGRTLWRERALVAVRQLLHLFWDDQSGGFFTTGSDAEALVVRPKE